MLRSSQRRKKPLRTTDRQRTMRKKITEITPPGSQYQSTAKERKKVGLDRALTTEAGTRKGLGGGQESSRVEGKKGQG